MLIEASEINLYHNLKCCLSLIVTICNVVRYNIFVKQLFLSTLSELTLFRFSRLENSTKRWLLSSQNIYKFDLIFIKSCHMRRKAFRVGLEKMEIFPSVRAENEDIPLFALSVQQLNHRGSKTLLASVSTTPDRISANLLLPLFLTQTM